MADNMIFKRYELKYLISKKQKDIIVKSLSDYMTLDQYGKSEIRSLYFDTPNYLLIRKSLDKPIYKEKLRLRSYGKVTNPEGKVFVELKKKYESVVYKRRISMTESAAKKWLLEKNDCSIDSQIGCEIEYFRQLYRGIVPKTLLTYDREAYFMNDGTDFRVTFDDNILGRSEDLNLGSETYGEKIISDDNVLMELKCSNAMPMWMAKTLSCNKIFKSSFSKYGTYYMNYIYPSLCGNSYEMKRQSLETQRSVLNVLKANGGKIYA